MSKQVRMTITYSHGGKERFYTQSDLIQFEREAALAFAHNNKFGIKSINIIDTVLLERKSR